jgi:septal ring factor EnvC (AmiA/AmiB activator)
MTAQETRAASSAISQYLTTNYQMKYKPSNWNSASMSIALLAGLLLACTSYAAEDRDEAQQELMAVNSAIKEIQSWLVVARTKQSETAANLQQSELKISDTLHSVAANEQELFQTRTEIDTLATQAEKLELHKAEQSAILSQTIRTAYMTGNQTVLKVLLNQEDIAKSARMLHYHRLFTASQLANIESFKETLDELAKTNWELSSKASELENLQIQLKQEMQTLSESKKQREIALAQLKADMSSRESELEQLQINQVELQQLIEQINRAVADIPSVMQNSPFIKQRGKLQMPADGKIIKTFGSRYGESDLKRQGITIKVNEGTPVQAIHPGRVVFSDWLRGAGLLVIVDHGEGYMSLYGNNQALSKQTGDWVKAGDILATSGRSSETINNEDASIYFEIRHHGEAQNPRGWIAK